MNKLTCFSFRKFYVILMFRINCRARFAIYFWPMQCYYVWVYTDNYENVGCWRFLAARFQDNVGEIEMERFSFEFSADYKK